MTAAQSTGGRTVIVGENSNLSRRLAGRLPQATVLSARRLLPGTVPALSGGPFRLVLNNFQPATRLSDVSDPVGYIDLAIATTARVLDLLPGSACTKVIYTSSASVYGDNGHCAEDDPVSTTDLHSALKLANEELVRKFCRLHGLDVTIARVFNMYGGDDRFSVIGRLRSAATGGSTFSLVNDGSAVRDYVHVDDVVTSYLALLETTDVPLINVASGVGVSVRDLVAALASQGVHLKLTRTVRSEVRQSVANVDLLALHTDVSAFANVLAHLAGSVR